MSESLASYDERRTIYLAQSGVEMTHVDELRFGQVVLKKMTDAQKVEVVGGLDADDGFRSGAIIPVLAPTITQLWFLAMGVTIWLKRPRAARQTPSNDARPPAKTKGATR